MKNIHFKHKALSKEQKERKRSLQTCKIKTNFVESFKVITHSRNISKHHLQFFNFKSSLEEAINI